MRRFVFGDDAIARIVGQVGWRFIAACPPEIMAPSVMLGDRTAFPMIRSRTAAFTYCDFASRSIPGRHDDLDKFFSTFGAPAPNLMPQSRTVAQVHHSTIE